MIVRPAEQLISALNEGGKLAEVAAIIRMAAAIVTHHFNGGSKTISLRLGGNKVQFFKELSEIEFDSSDFDQYITGTIWLTDGTWVVRDENEVTGEGFWLHVTPPRLPEELRADVGPQIESVVQKLGRHTRVAEVAFRACAHGYTRGCAHNKCVKTPVDWLAAMLAEKLGELRNRLVHPDWYGVDCMEKLHTELTTLCAVLPTRMELTHKRLPQLLGTITWNLRTLINLLKLRS